ncbi:MAG: ChbG/HpnK family deacetylase [Anaerolineae bacterium]|nr:ChbG/HpnK family deacetylase [Anaerolineae bacterium]
MTRSLIVNADDFAHPTGTIEAISDLFELGVVTSTSVMVNQPDWPRAAEVLRAHPEWDAGIHLVMNDRRPVLPPPQVPSLIDAKGVFWNGAALLLRYPLISRSQLRAEWQAQIETFVTEIGRTPSHVDLHCHYPYVFPAWFRLSLELAVAHGHLPVRTPFDDGLEEKAPKLAKHYGFPAWFIRRQGARYRDMVRQYGLPRTNFWESRFSQDGNRTVEFLLDILDHLPEGSTEILCHPGTEGWRADDYRALRDPRVRERIQALGIEMIDYRAVSRVA